MESQYEQALEIKKTEIQNLKSSNAHLKSQEQQYEQTLEKQRSEIKTLTNCQEQLKLLSLIHI